MNQSNGYFRKPCRVLLVGVIYAHNGITMVDCDCLILKRPIQSDQINTH